MNALVISHQVSGDQRMSHIKTPECLPAQECNRVEIGFWPSIACSKEELGKSKCRRCEGMIHNPGSYQLGKCERTYDRRSPTPSDVNVTGGVASSSPSKSEGQDFENIPDQAGWDLTDSENGYCTPKSVDSMLGPEDGGCVRPEQMNGHASPDKNSQPHTDSNYGHAQVCETEFTKNMTGFRPQQKKVAVAADFEGPIATLSHGGPESTRDGEVVRQYLQHMTNNSSKLDFPPRPYDPDESEPKYRNLGGPHSPPTKTYSMAQLNTVKAVLDILKPKANRKSHTRSNSISIETNTSSVEKSTKPDSKTPQLDGSILPNEEQKLTRGADLARQDAESRGWGPEPQASAMEHGAHPALSSWHWTEDYGFYPSPESIQNNFGTHENGWWLASVKQEILDFADRTYGGDDSRVTPDDCERVKMMVDKFAVAYKRRWEVTVAAKKLYYQRRAVRACEKWRTSLDQAIRPTGSDRNAQAAASEKSQKSSWIHGLTFEAQGPNEGAEPKEELGETKAFRKMIAQGGSRNHDPQSNEDGFSHELSDNQPYSVERESISPRLKTAAAVRLRQNRFAQEVFNDQAYRVEAEHMLSSPKAASEARTQEDRFARELFLAGAFAYQFEEADRLSRLNRQTVGIEDISRREASLEQRSVPHASKQNKNDLHDNPDVPNVKSLRVERKGREQHLHTETESPQERVQFDGHHSNDVVQEAEETEAEETSSKFSLKSDRKIAADEISGLSQVLVQCFDDDDQSKLIEYLCIYLAKYSKPATKRILDYKLHIYCRKHNVEASYKDLPFILHTIDRAKHQHEQKSKRQKEVAVGFWLVVVAFFIALTAFCAALPHSDEGQRLVKRTVTCFVLLIVGSGVSSAFWIAFLPCIPGLLTTILLWFGVGQTLIDYYKGPELDWLRDMVDVCEENMGNLGHSISSQTIKWASFSAQHGDELIQMCRTNALSFWFNSPDILRQLLGGFRSFCQSRYQRLQAKAINQIVLKLETILAARVDKMARTNELKTTRALARLEKFEESLWSAEKLLASIESQYDKRFLI